MEPLIVWDFCLDVVRTGTVIHLKAKSIGNILIEWTGGLLLQLLMHQEKI